MLNTQKQADMAAGVKKIWTPFEIAFIKAHWEKLNSRQMSEMLGLTRTLLRSQMYKMGLKKMELEYWTDEQTEFLIDNYRSIGDFELAEIFNRKWHKEKGWTKKHIEKKRRYLGLKRTEEEICAVIQRNVDSGILNSNYKGVTNWLTTGPAAEGEIRMYRTLAGIVSPRVKIGRKWLWWQRWAWETHFGPVPKGYVVVFKDNDPYNTVVENLELLTRSESTLRYGANSSKKLSDAYVAHTLCYRNPDLKEHLKHNPDLIDLKRQQLLLNRLIKENEKIIQTDGR